MGTFDWSAKHLSEKQRKVIVAVKEGRHVAGARSTYLALIKRGLIAFDRVTGRDHLTLAGLNVYREIWIAEHAGDWL